VAARLLSLLEQHDARSVVITSPTAGAGKTTVTLNLAASLAAAGKDTVVISPDPHDTAMCIRTGVLRRPGLQELLQDKATLADALHDTDIEGLRVLPPGGSMKAPYPPLNIGRLTGVFDDLREATDVVLIEGPSVLGVADTAILAERADLTLLVVDIRRGRRADASAAVRALSHIESRLSGCVVNDPGRKQQLPESPQLGGPEDQSKFRGSLREVNQDATPSSIHSEGSETVARLRTGIRSADADIPSSTGGESNGRVADL